MSLEKSHYGKFFRNQYFHFKVRFEAFWSDSDQKTSTKKFSSHFSKEWLCPQRKVIIENFFEIEIFILKYVSDHSELIPIKKTNKNNCLCLFLNHGSNFSKTGNVTREKSLWEKIFKSRFSFQNMFWTILNRFWSKKSTKNFRHCHFIDQKWPKIESFLKILGQNYFFKLLYSLFLAIFGR